MGMFDTVFKGNLNAIGTWTVNMQSGKGKVESIEIEGLGELRNIRMNNYMYDHLSRSLGEDVVLGVLYKNLIALKSGGKCYTSVGSAYVPSIVIAVVGGLAIGITQDSSTIGWAYFGGVVALTVWRITSVVGQARSAA